MLYGQVLAPQGLRSSDPLRGIQGQQAAHEVEASIRETVLPTLVYRVASQDANR